MALVTTPQPHSATSRSGGSSPGGPEKYQLRVPIDVQESEAEANDGMLWKRRAATVGNAMGNGTRAGSLIRRWLTIVSRVARK